MSSVCIVLAGISLIALSGFPAAFFPSRSNTGQRCTVVLFSAGSLIGIAGTVMSLLQDSPPALTLRWSIPWGQFSVSVDALSAFFLLLIFTVPMLGAIYGLGYWKQSEHRDSGQRLGIFFGLLTAAMAMIVISRDSVLFLIVWETMALSAFFAASVEDDKIEVRKAMWIYLVCTHIGTLILYIMFVLWHGATGSFALFPTVIVTAHTASAIFLVSLFGFGFKAGLMPFHVWLPGAHANAPCHVSAVMSGVILKMGVYGILRTVSLFSVCEPWWGTALIIAGSITALLGIAFAMGQSDLKRVLAYSSIENVGIITTGIGIALLGKAYHIPVLTLLGLGGALFHVWNHGLFKSLMFLNAGAIIHATDTRDIENLGGLAKKMPLTAFLFILGAMAISALPPLNGFAGEWLIYMGIFNTLSVSSVSNLPLAALSAVVLAMVGALAVAVFVRLYSVIFSGERRTEAGSHAHEGSLAMKIPVIITALICVTLGVEPALVAPILDRAVRACAPSLAFAGTIGDTVPQLWVIWMNAALVALIAIGGLWYFFSLRKKTSPGAHPTWDCAYARPKAKMQYTGASFGQSVITLFSFALFPSAEKVKITAPFPAKVSFRLSVPDTVLDRIILPFFSKAHKILPKVYILQQGQTYLYVLYVAVITAVLFLLSMSGVVQ